MDRRDIDDADLSLVAQVVSDSAVKLDERSRRAIRSRVMTQVVREAFKRRGRMVFRRAMAATTVAATLLGGVSYAAAVSLPGDAFYPVKRLSETLTLQVLPDGELQQRFLFTLATRRADELSQLSIGDADEALMSRTLEQFRLTTSAAYGDGPSAGEALPSETRLREHVETAPESTKAQLQQALDEASDSPSAPKDPMTDSDDSGTGDANGTQGSSPIPGEDGAPSTDATGPVAPGRP